MLSCNRSQFLYCSCTGNAALIPSSVPRPFLPPPPALLPHKLLPPSDPHPPGDLQHRAPRRSTNVAGVLGVALPRGIWRTGVLWRYRPRTGLVACGMSSALPSSRLTGLWSLVWVWLWARSCSGYAPRTEHGVAAVGLTRTPAQDDVLLGHVLRLGEGREAQQAHSGMSSVNTSTVRARGSRYTQDALCAEARAKRLL